MFSIAVHNIYKYICYFDWGASCLPTLRLTTHSSRCLKAFHCSSAVSSWWAIVTWSNERHSFNCSWSK